MRWTKLNFPSGKFDLLSSYDLPWQSSICIHNKSTAFKVRYGGTLGGLSKWVDKAANVLVWHEKGSYKIVEVIVPSELFSAHKTEAFSESIRKFLASDHDGLTTEESAYLDVLSQAAERTPTEKQDLALSQ